MAQKFIGETSGKYWKQKNDETYVNEEELIKITDLEESESVDDDDLLIKGNASTGTMLRIKVANFLDGIKEKLLGNTDISSVGDGTVTGAISTNAQTITANKSDADSKYTELNSALAEIPTIQSGYTNFQITSGEEYSLTFSKSFSSAPKVVVVPYHASSQAYITLTAISATGFSFRATATTTGSTFRIYWIAVS